ncbi:MAG: SusC/RagA family TonB-linked outer membrane protein [Bacteroidia bacterium]|nr:SusC/RagA family TonB-linked outer membrane protein [Bacteroidia bacterium]
MKKFKMLLVAVATLVCGLAYGQNITVSGQVTDGSTGEPLSGAAILVKGTPKGVVADNDGNYSIVVSPDATLGFTTIGFKDAEVAVNGRSVINVALEPDLEMLDETIVVAFGTTTKEAFTGSASVMRSEDLEKRQVTNVANALVGSVAGLQMRGASGAPGAGAGSMNIRGISSMYADTEPLIIVDGAPYSASLSNIAQNDIESITVLKDAASAALYGSRGASGVIIITTKRSKGNNAVVNFDAKWGVNSRAIQDYETITDPGQYYEAAYAQLFNNNYYGSGMSAEAANLKANSDMLGILGYQVYTVPDGEQLVGLNGKLNPKATLGYGIENGGTTYWLQPDNWRDYAYKKSSFRHEYNVNVSGGSDKGSFYASMGYLNDDGIIPNSAYDRLTARVRADYQIKKWLKVGANVGYVRTNTQSTPNMDTDLGSTNIMYYATAIAPIYPVFVREKTNGGVVIRTDENGNQQYDYGVAGKDYPVNRAFLQTGNPIGSNQYNTNYSVGNQLNGTFNVTFDITDFLRVNAVSTVTWGNTFYHHYDNALYGPKVSIRGELVQYQNISFRQNHLQTINYYDTFGDHSIDVLLGHEFYKTQTNYLDATAQGLFSPDIQQINAAAKKADSSGYESVYNTEGFFARAEYNYAQKYYASASFRRDGSSRFSMDRAWGNFWSVGAAWILSKENFLSSANWVDMLKVKASIGQQGNDNIGNWQYTDLYTLSNSGTYTMSPSFSSLGNPNITWETTTNMNVGAEFSFFGGRLSGNVDFYNKLAKDQLFWLSVPESAGARGYYGNMGDIRNLGFEIALTGDIIRTNLVDWSVNLNMASNKDQILSLPEAKMVDPENGVKGFSESSKWLEIGGSLYTSFRHKYAGVNENGEALYYVDPNLNGKTDRPGTLTTETTTNPNVASYYKCGNMLPKLFGGFGTSLRVWQFDLSLTFDYQIGGLVYDSRYQKFMSPWADSGDAGSTFHVDYLKSWSPNNTSSNLPRWQYTDQYSAASSDRFLTDASYLNFQSFTLGFTLKKSWIKGIQKARIFASGENLWFWSARKGLDPRYSYTGNTYVAVYSPVRTISGGIQLTF